jgi:hypothetical protein
LALVGSRHVLSAPHFILFAAPWLMRVCEKWGLTPLWQLAVAGALVATNVFAARGMQTGMDTTIFPIQACDFIQSQSLPQRFLNAYPFGGYWIGRFGLERLVFIDGRFPTVDGYLELRETMESAQRQSPAKWNGFLDHWGVQAALLEYPAPQPGASIYDAYFPRAKWALVYWDDVALVFVRRNAVSREFLKQFEYTACSPDMTPMDFARRFHAADAARQAAIRSELQRNIAATINHRRALTLLQILKDS